MQKLQLLSEELSEVEAGKVEQRSYKLKLDNSLQKIEELYLQIERVHKEKDEALNRCIEARTHSIELSKKIENFQTVNQEVIMDSGIIKKKGISLEQIIELSESMENSFSIEIEKEALINTIIQLKQEIASLRLHNKEIEILLELSVSTKNQAISLLEMNCKDEIERIQNEFALTSKKMMEDASVALERVHNQQDQLHTRLKSERRSTQISLNKAMMLERPQFVCVEEVNNIKKQLASVLKENAKLGRDYQEVVLCWKDSNKMLRVMQRAMENEAKKMLGVVHMREKKNRASSSNFDGN